MRQGRLLPLYVREQIGRTLGHRSWTWLAREAGIPQSTLATQKSIPKFSITTLVAVADALGQPVSHFLPPSHAMEPDDARDQLVAEVDLRRRWGWR